MTSRREEAATRAAVARTKEAAARMVGVVRDYAGDRGRRPAGPCPPPAEIALRWCLLAEHLAGAFEARLAAEAPRRPPAADFASRARYRLAVWTARMPRDAALEAATDPGGVAPPDDALRTRIGSAAAAFLAALRRAAAATPAPLVTHATCGPLGAPEWAELLLVFASDAERRLLEASVATPSRGPSGGAC